MLGNLTTHKHLMSKPEDAPPSNFRTVLTFAAEVGDENSFLGSYGCNCYSVPYVASNSGNNEYVSTSGANMGQFLLKTGTTYKITVNLVGKTPVHDYQVGAPRYECFSSGAPLLSAYLASSYDSNVVPYNPSLSHPDPYSVSLPIYDEPYGMVLGVKMSPGGNLINTYVHAEDYFYVVTVPESSSTFAPYMMVVYATLFKYFFGNTGDVKEIPGLDYTISVVIELYVS